mmetsp:Transcript_9362/g.24172  ORF Transcript_9362/g.24172 Transcript_9362/m.24172 type:complete len:480 (+) Transcript_9362:101-1540(+)
MIGSHSAPMWLALVALGLLSAVHALDTIPSLRGAFANASEMTRVRGKWLEIEIGKEVFSVANFGARGDGVTLDTKAIQAAFDAAKKAGGGTVLFPANHGKGVYLTNVFQISGSHTMVELPLGARVVFENNRAHYNNKTDLITAHGVSHIGFRGGGVFDAQGASWWSCRSQGCFRPRFVHSTHVSHLLMMDVTWKDSPNHVLELYADFTELAFVTVLNPPSETDDVQVNGTYGPSHNTDAVDVHGTPFYIHDCHFDTGDDNVAVHASDLLVEDCYFGHGHGASIGSIKDGQLENITFRNIIFNRTTAAAKIKTHPKGTGYVRNCTWENLILHEVRETLVIDMFYGHNAQNESTDLAISDITIRNVTNYGKENPETKKTVSPGYIHCQASSPCRDIRMIDVRTIDVMNMPMSCYNAYGTEHNVVPAAPCLLSSTHEGDADDEEDADDDEVDSTADLDDDSEEEEGASDGADDDMSGNYLNV